jgi:hypothetical protein
MHALNIESIPAALLKCFIFQTHFQARFENGKKSVALHRIVRTFCSFVTFAIS